MKTRVLVAAAVLVSAVVHLRMWFDGVRDQHVIGPAFMLNAVGGIVIVALVLLWRHWLPLLLAVGFGVSTIGAFVVAATAGLYGIRTQWEGAEVWTAAASEAVAIVAGAMGLLGETTLDRRRGGSAPDVPRRGRASAR